VAWIRADFVHPEVVI
jgi:hypothetical protein